ncbi:unnamed protein product [Camellia sinensis]
MLDDRQSSRGSCNFRQVILNLQNATQKSQKVFVHVLSEIDAHEIEEIGISGLVRIVTKHDNCSSTYMGTCKRCPEKDGQDTKEELQKRNLRDELEERERWHFLLKDKSYNDRDRRKGGHLLLEGAKRDAEDRLIPRSVDADDADVELKSSDGRLSLIANLPELIHIDDDDDEDDEDDTEALLLELEQIKKELAIF